MSDIATRIRAEQIAARKGADKDRTLVLGTVLASLKNREIELSRAVTDVEVIDVLRKQIKQRQDSVEQFRLGKREDLAVREEYEIGVLRTYLPADVDPEQIRAVAREAVAGGAADIGAVMAALMARFKGQADGRTINQIAREALQKQ
jgi:uncharacterized protein